MKLHFFTFRKPSTENVKEQPIVPLSNRESDDGCTNHGVGPLLEKTKNGFFLFRIIRHGRSKNGNRKSSINTVTPTASHTSSSPTSPSSGTNENNNVTTSKRDNDLPVSFIRIVPNESSKRDLLQKMTSTNLMQKHGLDRSDSILSYFKQVDDAYNEMMVIVDDSPHDVSGGNHEEFYDEQEAIDQGISMITMDPALMYKHSIILDEYSWQSFHTLYESERYDNDDDEEESRDPPADARMTTVRYYDI